MLIKVAKDRLRVIEIGDDSDSFSDSAAESYVSLRDIENYPSAPVKSSKRLPQKVPETWNGTESLASNEFVRPNPDMSLIQENINDMFRDGIPNRILFFSAGNGLQKSCEIASFLLFTPEKSTTAKRSYVPQREDEVQTYIYDEISVIENDMDWRIMIHNKTRKTTGYVPISVITPVNDTKIIISHEYSSCDNANYIDYLLLLHEYTQQVDLRVLYEEINVKHITSMFETANSKETVECFIKGDAEMCNRIGNLLKTLKGC